MVRIVLWCVLVRLSAVSQSSRNLHILRYKIVSLLMLVALNQLFVINICATPPPPPMDAGCVSYAHRRATAAVSPQIHTHRHARLASFSKRHALAIDL